MARSSLRNRRNLTISFPSATLDRVEALSRRWMVDKSDVIRIAVGELVAPDRAWPKSLPVVRLPPHVERELRKATRHRGPYITLEELFR